MVRLIPIAFALTALAAAPALAQSRPSVGGIASEQERLATAICAKADVDGDSYRPFVCPPRCDCFQAAGQPSSCQQTSADTYQISFSTLAGTCTPGQFCSYSSLQPCSLSLPLCFTPGETCVSGFLGSAACVAPCTTDANCPPRPSGTGVLAGVTTPDSPAPVACTLDGVEVPINSNDALQCLAEVEALSPCE